MKHIQEKHDWYYEFRPYLIALIGVVGLFYCPAQTTTALLRVSQFCGFILLFSAAKILLWRREYRSGK